MKIRDHGGNLDAARARFGGDDWLDLSTGINRAPYPVPAIPPDAWQSLPTRAAQNALGQAAKRAWGCRAPMVALAGAQAAIQLVPMLHPPGRAKVGRAKVERAGLGKAAVLGPTYNEHAACLRAAGWDVTEADRVAQLPGADLVVIVNPNNPDGRQHTPGDLMVLAQKVGLLIVDESFADPTPQLSLLPYLSGADGEPLVLRSFGKFYGLAGVRLGFAAGPRAVVEQLAALSGPWPVSGPAIETGLVALADTTWATATTARLADDAVRLDHLAAKAGWMLVGGTHLFRLYDTPDATAAQEHLARRHIWSRIFPWHESWLRLGLPGTPDEWARVESALS